MTRSDNFSGIEHAGIVQRSDKKSVTIKIISVPACSGCQAEGSCSLSGIEEKLIEVSGHFNVMPGEDVTVVMKKSTGYAAVLLGYVLPFILLLIVLIILISLSVPELAAGLVSIGMLAPYYFLIWLLRKRINNKFNFTLKLN
jgi:sigma-E factor negative regulatory protein RseC